MNYRKDKYGDELSILGFGCMRFPMKAGKIDMKEAEREIMHAVDCGINYFDTAYIYPGSEAVLGEILEKNDIRKKVFIATKLPHYLIKSPESLDKIFNEELMRLRTDYIDYYLMHMLTDKETWERLKGFGIEEWIEKKKQEGKIRRIGFSYHGNTDAFCELVDAYEWDFCMIQYNYMDENTQAGRRGLRYANGKGLPVFIMEPLRGGRLAKNLPERARKIFEDFEPERTPAQWAFRWLWNQPEVSVVLSGMNSMEMLDDNLKTASDVKIGELGHAEEKMFKAVVKALNSNVRIGCTGCGYCMPCPKNVDIPGAFSAYNRRFSDGWFHGMKDYAMCTALRKNSTAASNCVGCGKCEQHCPQKIEIRKELENVRKKMEGPVYKIFCKIAKLVSF